MKKNLVTVFLCLLLFAFAFYFYFELSPLESKSADKNQPELAKVLLVEGEVWIHRHGEASLQEEVAKATSSLKALDVLRTAPESRVRIEIGRDQFEVQSNTRLVIEPDSQKPEALWLTLLGGTIKALNAGPWNENLKIYRDGVMIGFEDLLYDPSQSLVDRQLMVKSPGTAANRYSAPGSSTEVIQAPSPELADNTRNKAKEDSTKPTSKTTVILVPTKDDEPLADSQHTSPPPKTRDARKNLPEIQATLSNELIHATLARQSGYFAKCYLNYILRTKDKNKKGTVLLNVRIENSGRVSDSQVAQSDFQDDLINRCVAEVVQRTAFRTFEGPVLQLEYPITLE